MHNAHTPVTPSRKERLILELLAEKGQRKYGLELAAESKGRLKRATVYVTLGRMEKKGLVVAEAEKFADDSGLVPRRMCRATTYGLRVLQAWANFSHALGWGDA
jgi:DNA-binding PadR family transcriptional regulator